MLTHFQWEFRPVELEFEDVAIVVHLIPSDQLELCFYWLHVLPRHLF